MVVAQGCDHPIEHRWGQEQVDEISIELSSATRHQFLGCFVGTTCRAIPAAVGDRVECVGDRDDSRRERDRRAAKAARISRPVPPLVV
jgi:hypothetical protein